MQAYILGITNTGGLRDFKSGQRKFRSEGLQIGAREITNRCEICV